MSYSSISFKNDTCIVKELIGYIENGEDNKFKNVLNELNDDEKFQLLTTNYFGMNCIHTCCKLGNLGLLEYLLNIESVKLKKNVLIDLPNKDGDTCLLTACSRDYSDLAARLIYYGADVSKKNNFGRTALHYCALTGNLEIFELLINNGADRYCEDALKTTPLYVAANHGNAAIVEYMVTSHLCSRSEAIDAYELLGCAFIKLLKFNDGAQCWSRALKERSHEPVIKKNIDVKPNALYMYEVEFKNQTELDSIVTSPKKMVLQSILIMERIFGANHLISLKHLSESAFYFERNEDYDLSLLLIINKIRNQNNSQIIAFINTYDSFHKLLVLLMKRRHDKKIDHNYCLNFLLVFELFANQLKQNLEYLSRKLCAIKRNLKEFDDSLVLLGCYIIFFTSEVKTGEFDVEITFKIKSIIYNLIKLNLKCFITGYTVLHLALSTKLDSISNINGSFDVVKLLIECGAQAMEFDCCNNTALHICMGMSIHSKDERLQIAKYLLDSGAHLDAANTSGQTPINFLNEENISINSFYSSINPLKYLSLKCFAAQAIKKHNIAYKGILPTTLEHFVSFH